MNHSQGKEGEQVRLSEGKNLTKRKICKSVRYLHSEYAIAGYGTSLYHHHLRTGLAINREILSQPPAKVHVLQTKKLGFNFNAVRNT